MSKSRKNDKPVEPEEGEVEAPKPAPWAIEIEFYNKPSFMCSVLEIQADNEHVSIVQDNGTVIAFPYDAVSKVLVMHTTKRKTN